MDRLTNWIRRNHMLLMVVGCVAPLLLITATSVFNIPLSTVGIFIVMLLCPLSHVFMMRGMGHGNQSEGKSCHAGTEVAPTNAKDYR